MPPRRQPNGRESSSRLRPPGAADGLDELSGLPLFAAVVAHEIRNPLSAVKIALQTVERQSKMPANDATRLRIALREVATIEKVLTHVLEWARPVELQLEDVPVPAIIESAIAEVHQELQERQIRLARHEEAKMPLRVDPGRAAQALAELLRNAIDASPPGGTIQLSTTERDGMEAFTIENEGDPLTAEDCQRAFDPFFTRKARGIGLGLPRTSNIAHGHGGGVALEPRESGGARATLTLPLARTPA